MKRRGHVDCKRRDERRRRSGGGCVCLCASKGRMVCVYVRDVRRGACCKRDVPFVALLLGAAVERHVWEEGLTKSHGNDAERI